jgi:hypothetical protein
MKATNYLCTMTEIKSMGFPYLSPGNIPADSNYCLTKLVFGNNFLYNWYYGMMYGYDFSRLPRYQDFLQVKLVISVSKAPLSTPTYNTLFYYQITVIIDGSYAQPTQDIRITDTLPVGMTLLDFAYVYANGSSVPNPTSNYYTVNTFQSNTPSGAFDISLKSGVFAINRPTIDSYSPITIGFTAKATTTGSLTNTAYATIPSGAFTYQTSGSNTINIAATTTTTTTTQPPSNVSITTLNGLDVNSFTVYINGAADTGWKSGTRSYPSGTVIKIIYNSNACGVTLNGGSYASNTNITLSGGASQSFSLNNANNWTTTGYQCIGNVYYTNQTNSCGATRQIQTYPGSTCDCVCNQNCNGTYNGPSVCLGNDLVQYSYYNCNGNPTGNYTVVQYCSCSCNQACNGTYNGSPYCVGNEQRQDYYYNCNGAYAGTNVLSGCSCSCNAGCNGTYWEYYCTNYGVAPYTQRRRQKYYCNNANTGVDEFVTDCSGSCGVNASPTWNNSGSPYCSGCNLNQDQTQINPCCFTPPYGSTRTVDLGVNSDCGSWNQSYYCEGYTKWSKETNTCTGAIRNQYIVEYNSPYCGYVPPSTCRTYEIIAYNSDEYVSGIYTNCAGFSDSFSFYGGPGPVGSVCAQPSSVYVTSGNGGTSDVGGC